MLSNHKRLLLAAVAAGGLSVAADFDETRLRTTLAGGPLGGVTASGSVDFQLRPLSGDRSFRLEVEGLNLPAGTTLQVFVNNEPLGRLIVSGPPARGGELELASRDGASVPKLEPGDVVSVRGTGGVLLSGVLQRRILDDSPITPAPTAAPLLAATFPDDRRTNSARLFVEVSGVDLREGTELEVEVNGRRAGRIRLQGSRRGGELELDSRNGERIEQPKAGDLVRVLGPNGPVLAGAL